MIAAAAAIALPGSTDTRDVTPRVSHASRRTEPQVGMVGASSPATYGTPSPPPSTSSGRLSGTANAAITSAAFAKLAASNTFEPMWQCTPINVRTDEALTRSTAMSASPFSRLKPNLESFCPVEMNSWVWAETPGVIRSKMGGIGARDDSARRSKRSISSNESTTIRCTPASIAMVSSATLLLFPWSTHADAGTPAESAIWSSPPEATSSIIPSEYARSAIARQRKAFVAYTAD